MAKPSVGWWEVGSGQWDIRNGQREIGNGRYKMGKGRWVVGAVAPVGSTRNWAGLGTVCLSEGNEFASAHQAEPLRFVVSLKQ